MPGVGEREGEAVELVGVGHDVEGEVQRAAPDVIDLGVAQLRIDSQHAAAQNFGAAANGAAGFGEKGSASAEEHAAVRGEAIVVQIILGIVDHAIAGAELGGEFFRQDFGDDDVGADGNDFLLQRGGNASGVAAGGYENVAGTQGSARRGTCAACSAPAVQ